MKNKSESKASRARVQSVAKIFTAADGSGPLHRSLAAQIRERIVGGSIGAGTRLPTIRALAKELGLNRNVVEKAFRELRTRGLITGKQRGGTWVTSAGQGRQRQVPRAVRNARWVAQSAGSEESDATVAKWDLRPGQVCVRGLPLEVWRRACREAGRHLPPADYGDPAGDQALRESLAEYLGRRRGFAIDPDSVLVTHGASAAISLVARAVLRRGDLAAVEDPGYSPTLDSFERCGARVLRLPVEFETGHQLDVLGEGADAPLVVHLTPAHQYPLGVRLPPRKREAIIRWARRNGSLIIENDYDHEFSYDTEQLAPLASAAPDCVALVGTFSKVLSPSMRMGFIAGPSQLMQRVRSLVSRDREQVSWPLQKTLHWLLRSGGIDSCIARNRRDYLQLRNAIREAFLPFKELIELRGDECGLHVTLRMSPAIDVRVVHRALLRAGIRLELVGEAQVAGRSMNSLLLGYGHLQLPELQAALQQLVTVLNDLRRAWR